MDYDYSWFSSLVALVLLMLNSKQVSERESEFYLGAFFDGWMDGDLGMISLNHCCRLLL